jgi:hypothetical protein
MAERSGCATALMWVSGLILTLPGMCFFSCSAPRSSPTVRPYQTQIVWAAAIILIRIVAYLIYDFSRDRPDRPG